MENEKMSLTTSDRIIIVLTVAALIANALLPPMVLVSSLSVFIYIPLELRVRKISGSGPGVNDDCSWSPQAILYLQVLRWLLAAAMAITLLRVFF
jgi:hypothetical protein